MASDQRFEYKYLIPQAVTDDLCRIFRQWLELDEYCLSSPDNCYPVLSLYLDDQSMSLYRGTSEGLKNRYKLRVRAYNDRPESPVFFEIKSRVGRVIRKKRAPVKRENWEAIIAGQAPSPHALASFDPEAFEGLVDFTTRTLKTGASPVCFVRYRRQAFRMRPEKTLRMTLDWNVTTRNAPDWDLRFDGDDWQTVDLGADFEPTVLEVKFSESFPSWFQELVRSFDLRRASVPKYVLSVNALGKQVQSRPVEGRIYQ